MYEQRYKGEELIINIKCTPRGVSQMFYQKRAKEIRQAGKDPKICDIWLVHAFSIVPVN